MSEKPEPEIEQKEEANIDNEFVDYLDELEDQCEFDLNDEAMKAEMVLIKNPNNKSGVRKQFDSADYAMESQKSSEKR
jgi:hypothetical protein